MHCPLNPQTPLDPDTLLERYGDRIYRVARSMSKNDADAEDVMQNTLLKVLRRRETFRSEADPMGWIYRITMNEAREIHRRRQRCPSVSLDELPAPAGIEDPSEALRGPQHAAAREETAALVRAAVHALRPSYREAVVLRDLGGLPYREAAASMHLSLAAFKTRLHRARLLLRESLSLTAALAS